MELTLPTSEDSECVLIGRMLSSVNAVNAAIDMLEPEDFFKPLHVMIFRIMRMMYTNNLTIEPAAVAAKMEEEFPGKGDYPYLLGLTMFQTSHEVETFIGIIKNCSILRRMIGACKETMIEAQQTSKDPTDIYGVHCRKIDEIVNGRKKSSAQSVTEVLEQDFKDSGKNFIQWVEWKQEQNRLGISTITGLQTTYPILDKMLDGLNKKHYIIIGARPGTGKSTFVLNLIHNLANQGKKVGFFSLEMSSDDVALGLMAIDANVHSEKIRHGVIFSDEYQRLYVSTKQDFHQNVFVDDQPELRYSQLKARAKRWVEQGVDILFVDYLGEVKADEKFSSRQEEIQRVSKGLRAIAKDLNVPLVCICQLNRESEKDKRKPIKSDLRESGQIEADAHAILLLHRPQLGDKDYHAGVTELIVCKNRFGRTGTIHYEFSTETGKFKEHNTLKKDIEDAQDYKREL